MPVFLLGSTVDKDELELNNEQEFSIAHKPVILSQYVIFKNFFIIKKYVSQLNPYKPTSFLWNRCFWFLFDLILYVLSTIFQLYRDGSSWVELS